MTHATVLGWCPNCAKDVPLQRVRPWPGRGFSVGECATCASLLKAHITIPTMRPARPLISYLQEQA